MPTETATIPTPIPRGPRGLFTPEIDNMIYEPLISLEIVRREIETLENKNNNPELILSDEEMFKVLADVFKTRENVTEVTDRKEIKLGNVNIGYREPENKNGNGSIQEVWLRENPDSKNERTTTFSRHLGGKVTVVVTLDVEKPYHTPPTSLIYNDKKGILTTLKIGCK